jgi:hypothetical protein
MDQSQFTQNRRRSRSNVMLKATLETASGSLTVVLRNLSQDGALVQAEDLPLIESRVLFHRQGLSVPCRVAWSHGGYAGLEFEFPLFPKEMLRHVPPPQQRMQVPFKRRPGLAAKPLTPAERALIECWATEAPNKLGE